MALFILIGGIVLISKLFFITIVRGEYYTDQASLQHTGGKSYFNRGSIFFTEKNGNLVSAATLQNGYTLAINPRLIRDLNQAYQALSNIVTLEKEGFYLKASKVGDPYEELIARIDDETANKIRELKIPGVILEPKKTRFYPGAERAAHVVGFMGYNKDEYKGVYGIEAQYENVLKRKPSLSFSDFFTQLFAGVTHGVLGAGDAGEGDVVTTIEPSAQSYVENELKSLFEKWKPKQIGAIIMDPQTGAIRAMSALPTFDPGAKQTDLNILKNPLIENVYEMGSVVKPLTVAAAIDGGAITVETKYVDHGSLTIGDRKISNFDGKARGEINFQEVLNQSLNTGAVEAMRKLGPVKFQNYLFSFGLEDKTGIDLPNEAKGLLKNLDSGREMEFATASFGQGIAVTPIAITRAFASLANGGYLVTPHLVQKINYDSKLSDDVTPERGRQVLKTETSKEITKMLVEVVDTSLLNGKAKNEHYSIAAKTGTAQLVARESGGGYYKDRYLHSFFGYFPAIKPEFLIFIFMEDPQNVTYASQTLADPFIRIVNFLINYYQISPDR